MAVLAVALGPTVPAARAALLSLANDDAYTTAFETGIDVDAPGVLGNDLNVGSGEAQLTEGASHGSLTLRADGSFHYEPDNGFSGTDRFHYKLTGLIATVATVSITIKGPIPTPTPTATPTPRPTPTPEPTPTPPPSELPPLPTLPPLTTFPPFPTLTPPTLLPTPTPTVMPTRPPNSAPAATPTRAVGPSDDPIATATPVPDRSAAPGGGAGPIAPVGSDPRDSSGGGSGTTDPAPNALLVGPPSGSVDLGDVHIGGMGLAVEWLVPTLVVTVPGLLVIFAILAQGAGALFWLPYVRRTLGGDRRRPVRHATH